MRSGSILRSVVLSAAVAMVCLGAGIRAEAQLTAAQKKEADALVAEVMSFVGNVRGPLTSLNNTYKTSLDQSGKAYAETKQALVSRKFPVDQSIGTIEAELKKAILERFGVETELLIIPEVVKLNNDLVAMTPYFRQQAGDPAFDGPEVLEAPLLRFQNIRKAMSALLFGLVDELTQMRSVVRTRKTFLLETASQLRAIYQSGPAAVTSFDQDYYVLNKLELLELQKNLAQDLNRLNIGKNLDGTPGQIQVPCGALKAEVLLDNLHTLAYATEVWPDYLVDVPLQAYPPVNITGIIEAKDRFRSSIWSGTYTYNQNQELRGPYQLLRDSYIGTTIKGIYRPAKLDSLSSCAGTKQVILDDLKVKVARELGLGNLSAARRLDIEATRLFKEIANLRNQEQQVRHHAGSVLASIERAVSEHSFAPEGNQPWEGWWKTSVPAGVKNFERFQQLNTSTLQAMHKLAELAVGEFQVLISDSDDAVVRENMFSVAQRLETIANHGLDRLDLELSSAQGSLNTMALNIRSAEGIRDQGGLGEAIIVYGRVVDIRREQMLEEQTVELPERKAAAEKAVADLEKSRDDAFALRSRLDVLLAQTESEWQKYRTIFDVLRPAMDPQLFHPVYVNVSRRLLSGLAGDRSYQAMQKSVEQMVDRQLGGFASFSTAAVSQPKKKACNQKNKKKRKKCLAAQPKLVRKLTPMRAQLEANMIATIDEAARALVGQTALSSLIQEISRAAAVLNGLKE